MWKQCGVHCRMSSWNWSAKRMSMKTLQIYQYTILKWKGSTNSWTLRSPWIHHVYRSISWFISYHNFLLFYVWSVLDIMKLTWILWMIKRKLWLLTGDYMLYDLKNNDLRSPWPKYDKTQKVVSVVLSLRSWLHVRDIFGNKYHGLDRIPCSKCSFVCCKLEGMNRAVTLHRKAFFPLIPQNSSFIRQLWHVVRRQSQLVNFSQA